MTIALNCFRQNRTAYFVCSANEAGIIIATKCSLNMAGNCYFVIILPVYIIFENLSKLWPMIGHVVQQASYPCHLVIVAPAIIEVANRHRAVYPIGRYFMWP